VLKVVLSENQEGRQMSGRKKKKKKGKREQFYTKVKTPGCNNAKS
jgi:ribosomal protein S27E